MLSTRRYSIIILRKAEKSKLPLETRKQVWIVEEAICLKRQMDLIANFLLNSTNCSRYLLLQITQTDAITTHTWFTQDNSYIL